jgi:transposase-like protein
MSLECPSCAVTTESLPEPRTRVIRFGKFYRRSDGQWVQRFRCLGCKKTFSRATFHPCYRQNKRHLNDFLRKLLCSCVSQRRVAKLLNISRTTVVRKLLFLSRQAELHLSTLHASKPAVEIMEFDDLETFEHTKLKPLSVILAVEQKSRRILGFEVARMPAKGLLARISRKKYGKRKDERKQARDRLLRKIKPLVAARALIKSDESFHYPLDVRRFFPLAEHRTFKGRRACVVGQGELKRIGFDPIFSINHTFAMLRANVNRLARRTWCTTKKPERLAAHLQLYALYHNQSLIKAL